MKDNTQNVQSGGIGLFGLLGILFIALKLTNYIDWSWWLVLLPLYGPITVAAILMILALFFAWISRS